jgi:hypothetical protein
MFSFCPAKAKLSKGKSRISPQFCRKSLGIETQQRKMDMDGTAKFGQSCNMEFPSRQLFPGFNFKPMQKKKKNY